MATSLEDLINKLNQANQNAYTPLTKEQMQQEAENRYASVYGQKRLTAQQQYDQNDQALAQQLAGLQSTYDKQREQSAKKYRETLADADRHKLNLGLPGGDTNCVNEPGLYSLVLGSRKPEAKAFKRWITHEVIPSIRKTGSYSAGNDIKAMRAEAMMRNAKTREANLWLKFAAVLDSRPHKQLCASYETQVLTGGQRVLPLPEVEKTYSAEEVGAMLGGLSGQKVGRIATKHGLKVPEYGRLTLDKSRYSSKEVETWRYNEAGVEALRQIVSEE